MKTIDEQIYEATGRGIVVGATIKSTFAGIVVVPDPPRWTIDGNGLYIDSGRYCIHDFESDRWATVITPAPSQGLEEGMATECSPAMRAAIIERARELGLPTYDTVLSSSIVAFRKGQVWAAKKGSTVDAEATIRIASHEFLARLEATAKKPKPIMIASDGAIYPAEFRKGSVKIGCTTVDNETVRAIAANLKD